MRLWFGCILMVGFILSGCGRSGFVRDGATAQDFYEDLYRCERERGVCGTPICAQQQNRTRNLCMMSRGWRITKDDGRFIP